MARTRETEDHITPGHRAPDVLCASVLFGRPHLVELPDAGEVVIGRDADCDLQIGSASVSRNHARLSLRAGEATILDLGSRNGTFVNGERLGAEPRRIGRGDEITLGEARLALFARATLPAGARSVLVRSALLRRLGDALDAREDLAVVALRTRARWFEVDAVIALLARLPAGAYAGALAEEVLVVACAAEQAASLVEGLDASLGRADLRGSSARSAEELVAAALRALSAGSDRPPASSSRSPAVRALHEMAERIAATEVSVLLVGETGVGKEVMARFIHEHSGRKGPLVSVNTAALPEALVESELFGHERGAFSGALATKTGLVEAAHGGTLFLDEIGDLPLPLQAKLLRVLEERAVRRLGATQERRIDVRVIAATHRDLERAVAEGTFRRDLLFRINACTLLIPPLRERAQEIEPLAAELLADLARRSPARRAPALSPEAAAVLLRYAWPGNVRELRNVLERGAALAEGGVIRPEHLPEHVRKGAPLSEPPRTAPPEAPSSGDLRGALADDERRRILDALDRCGGNQSQAAKILGLPRRTLAYKMSRLGIRVPG